jgi:Thioesterase domain
MLLAFEGTGTQDKGEFTNWHESGNPIGKDSFILRFKNRSVGVSKYFPGPDAFGSNTIDIYYAAKKYLESFGSLKNEKINLVGYSRGAYIAMCVAKHLEQNKIDVENLFMFDAVGMDVMIPENVSTGLVPNNVRFCVQVARSPEIGSRNKTMNYLGQNYEDGRKLAVYKPLPGSHASLGGFPNGAGIGDSPLWGQGDPNDSSGNKFHPLKEVTAWRYAADIISKYATARKVISSHILDDRCGPFVLMPEHDWYYAIYPTIQRAEKHTQHRSAF